MPDRLRASAGPTPAPVRSAGARALRPDRTIDDTPRIALDVFRLLYLRFTYTNLRDTGVRKPDAAARSIPPLHNTILASHTGRIPY